MVAVPPDAAYLGYFDWRTIGCLFCVLAVANAFRRMGAIDRLARAAIRRFASARSLAAVLVASTAVLSIDVYKRQAQDKYNGSSTVRGYPVKVYKATPENSPFGNPIPCGNDGTEIIHDSSDPRLKLWAIGAEGIHPDKFDA